MEAAKNTIFLCYRRDDSADVTGRIYDRLDVAFPGGQVFRDVDAIPLGVDFRDHVGTVLEKCRVVLVVLGPSWLKVRNPSGERRIDDVRDHVRLEIEYALLRKDIRLIPLLVGGADMPGSNDLPHSLQELAFRNGAEIRRDPDFRSDIERVIRQLHSILAGPVPDESLVTSGQNDPVPPKNHRSPSQSANQGLESARSRDVNGFQLIDPMTWFVRWFLLTGLASGVASLGIQALSWGVPPHSPILINGGRIVEGFVCGFLASLGLKPLMRFLNPITLAPAYVVALCSILLDFIFMRGVYPLNFMPPPDGGWHSSIGWCMSQGGTAIVAGSVFGLFEKGSERNWILPVAFGVASAIASGATLWFTIEIQPASFNNSSAISENSALFIRYSLQWSVYALIAGIGAITWGRVNLRFRHPASPLQPHAIS